MNSTSKPSPTPSDADIRAQARHWFISLREHPTRTQQAACDKWRRSNPAHDDAYRAIESVWMATAAPGQRLAEKEADDLAIYLTAMDRNRHRQRVRQRIAALSAMCVLMFAGAGWLEYPHWAQNLTADRVADKGERRDVMLTDGSRVVLDADSALSIDITPQARRVRLLRGAAFFDVAHAETPFIVATDAGEVRVLGTQFDVRLLEAGGVVTLARGSVAVTAAGGTQPTVLKPGQQALFNASGVGNPVNINPSDEMAWRDGRFIFYRARLADVVREVERYRHGRIFITTPSLADERVTGSFSLADSDAALASLQASVGFELRKVTERLVFISH